jgi:hypothetical protein
MGDFVAAFVWFPSIYVISAYFAMKFYNLNPVHGEGHLIQPYVIKFVSGL